MQSFVLPDATLLISIRSKHKLYTLRTCIRFHKSTSTYEYRTRTKCTQLTQHKKMHRSKQNVLYISTNGIDLAATPYLLNKCILIEFFKILSAICKLPVSMDRLHGCHIKLYKNCQEKEKFIQSFQKFTGLSQNFNLCVCGSSFFLQK